MTKLVDKFKDQTCSRTFCGVADAHGIESFMPKEANTHAGLMQLRATTNRQRHAVYFELELDEANAEIIEEQMQNGNCAKALLELKVIVDEEELPVRLAGGGDVAASFNLIPNPDLDPWG
jgi:CxxC motif-containing protein (DUF1111 family)